MERNFFTGSVAELTRVSFDEQTGRSELVPSDRGNRRSQIDNGKT